YYDPSLGRFLSQDPILGQDWQPQSHNRYTYVQNNPLAFVDPSGRFAFLVPIVTGAIGAVAAGTVYAITNHDNFNWGHFGVAVAGGAIVGAAAPLVFAAAASGALAAGAAGTGVAL